MTNYKKEEPRPYPDWGQLHTPPVPKTIEHYLADLIYAASLLNEPFSKQLSRDIIRYARRAWDLVPEETICVKCNKELAMNHPSKLCCGCYNEK